MAVLMIPPPPPPPVVPLPWLAVNVRRVVHDAAPSAMASLPFDDGSFDLVVTCLALHWEDDLHTALREIRRVLRPDGLVLASCFGGFTLEELRISLQLAEGERDGGISPHVSPQVKFQDVGPVLTSAGFSLPTVDVDDIVIHYPSLFHLGRDLAGMGESNAVLLRRDAVPRDTFVAAAAIYEELYGVDDAASSTGLVVPATFQVVYMTGWVPHASQSKPKPRGSATASLKEL